MKKVIFAVFVSLLCVATAFAGPFQPVQMKITGPSSIHYDFNGSDLDVPINVSGTSATLVFSVFTNGKASTINNITNGRLGWHFVNLIDTCVYLSNISLVGQGATTFTWNGQSSDGTAPVEADTYTYYVWGYDHISMKTPVANYIAYNWMDSNYILTKDESGNPLTKPIIYDTPDDESMERDMLPFVNRYTKWTIGDDPADSTRIESTYLNLRCSMFEYALNPADRNLMYIADTNFVDQQWISKYTWVPNEFASQDLTWGVDGRYSYSTDGAGQEHWFLPGVFSIGENQLVNPQRSALTISQLQYIDMETGDPIRSMSLAKYYIWERIYPDGLKWRNITPTLCDLVNGRMWIQEPYTFKMSVVDPFAEDQESFWLWHNGPGDGFHDHYAGHPDWNEATDVRQYSYRSGQDKNNFVITSTYDLGAVSFDCTQPDGTGIGMFNFAGEVAGGKSGVQYIEYGSAYDGMYMDNGSGTGGVSSSGWFYMASDSFRGTITNQVAVTDATPGAFTVAQNSPNPFNPTTTINFSIATPGKVTVDIYNVAGQKVDTLVNGSMSAGSHSVVWNASKFSTGVYFYTVKSGSFSKTMKMTLVK